MDTIQNVRISRHFTEDRSDRGIGLGLVNIILEFGDYRHDGHDAKIYGLTDRSFKQMKHAGMASKKIQMCRKKRSIRLIVSNDNCLITAYFADRRHQRHHD